MIRHILLIQFTVETSIEQIEAVRIGFLSMPTGVEGVTTVEWGENNSPEGKNAGYKHCVIMTFTDQQARKRYLHHPKHKALKDIFRPFLSKLIVFDYNHPSAIPLSSTVHSLREN
ncbi:Dabb family protein [Salmonella enterica subsp. enterica serovar Caracas]|nr:Dabb family protein [Salmonella enterica subsp. enterica serovar Caracas]